MLNGRLNLEDTRSGAPVHMLQGTGQFNSAFDYRRTTVASEAQDSIRGTLEATPLNQAYFSPDNFQIVQNKIRREVYERSKGELLVDPQSADELMIVMRAMYLQYGRNLPDNIAGQIAELNQMTADWCVPKIMAEASMYQTYLRDIQTLPVPLEHPVCMTMAGSKSQSLDRFF
jgi:hypothetical protein